MGMKSHISVALHPHETQALYPCCTSGFVPFLAGSVLVLSLGGSRPSLNISVFVWHVVLMC